MCVLRWAWSVASGANNKAAMIKDVSLFMFVFLNLKFHFSLIRICTGPSRPDGSNGESIL